MRTFVDVQESAASFLKTHTAQTHAALEEVLPQLQALQAKNDYTALLKNFYGYFKPVEALIETQLDNTILPDIKQRRKAHILLHDLTFSNAHAIDLAHATKLLQIQNKTQALGALYVLEGSTPGWRGITKML